MSDLEDRVVAALEVLACSGLPTQLVIGGLLALAGVDAFDRQGRLSVAFVVAATLLDTAAILGLVGGFLRMHGERPRDVLLGSRSLAGESWLGVLQIPLVFLVAGTVFALVQRFAPSLHNVTRNPLEGVIGSGAQAWIVATVAVVGGGLREEVQRAFVLHRFRQRLGGAWLGLALFTAAFGLGHLVQGRDAALTVAVLGLFWGLVYLRRGSIGSTVVSHSGFNAAQIIRYTLYGA